MTIAYPLAVVGAARGRGDLLNGAVRQLLAQRGHLDTSDGLYLRWYDDGRRTFRHWARGVTWYVLGMVRTLRVLDGCGHPLPSELLDDLPRLADWLMGLQRDDGLWTCFVDEPGTGPETSGSAGIAAALALAAGQGLGQERCNGRGAALLRRPAGLPPAGRAARRHVAEQQGRGGPGRAAKRAARDGWRGERVVWPIDSGARPEAPPEVRRRPDAPDRSSRRLCLGGVTTPDDRRPSPRFSVHRARKRTHTGDGTGTGSPVGVRLPVCSGRSLKDHGERCQTVGWRR